ncbi:3663_t:CDS:2 [Dentiscutata erythropus]|uniref:3663_t:CDS:1 n=1 Tax=Dentiscutata erythropus TaxID=1348616 RepID=A0A9N8WKW3_9GLOM|nr:3663_t:CDS:2 [Dentiscutata erythropus]
MDHKRKSHPVFWKMKEVTMLMKTKRENDETEETIMLTKETTVLIGKPASSGQGIGYVDDDNNNANNGDNNDLYNWRCANIDSPNSSEKFFTGKLNDPNGY